MRLLFVIAALLLSLEATGEMYASPIYSPLRRPPLNPSCTLYVYVSEQPVRGKYYMHYKVTSIRKQVSLGIDGRRVRLKKGQDYRSGLGQIFDRVNPLGIKELSATFDGNRHCAGSPVNIQEFVDYRAIHRVYADLLFRAPKKSESRSAWLNKSPKERVVFIKKILSSRERRRIEVESYYSHFFPETRPSPSAYSAVDSNLTIPEILAEIVSTPNYFYLTGGSNQSYLLRLHHDLFGRPPSDRLYHLLKYHLDHGESHKNVALYLISSSEFQTQMIRNWFQNYLKRKAKPTELLNASKKLKEGKGWATLQAELIAKDEYLQLSTLSPKN